LLIMELWLQALSILRLTNNYPIFSVKMVNPMKVRLAITGNDVYKELIKDKFQDVVRKKLLPSKNHINLIFHFSIPTLAFTPFSK